MAPITWRNVDDPDLGKAARILEGAVSNWDRGFSNLADTAATVRANQKTNRSAAAFPLLAGISSGSDVDRILAQVNGTVDPRDMTPELQQAILKARGTGLGYDESRASTDSTRSSTARANEDHSRQIAREDQEAAMAGDVLSSYQNSLWGDQFGTPASDGGPPLNDRELLARTLMAEAGGEGYDGMLAAGSVIANRARANDGNLRGVILAPGQFSAWNGVTGYAGGEGGLDMNGIRPSEDAYAVADAIQSGNYRDPTGGATHYYNPDAADPDWGARAGGNWTRIGNHVFGTAAGGAPQVAGGGVPQRRPMDIAGIVPKDNRLGIDYYLGLADRMYRAQDTAITGQRSDQNYFETQAQKAQAEQLALDQQQLRDQGWQMATGYLNQDEAQRAIMALGLPQDQTQLLLEGAKSAFDLAPAAFTPETRAEMDSTQLNGLRTLAINDGADDASLMMRSAMEAVGVLDPTAAAADEAVTGANTTPSVKQQGVLDIIQGLTSRADALNLDETAPSLLGVVNEVAQEENVDPRIVAALLEHSLYETSIMGDLQVDKDRLRENVRTVADPVLRGRLMIQENDQADRRDHVQELIDANLKAQDALSIFENRPGPEAARRAEEARKEVDRTRSELDTFMEGYMKEIEEKRSATGGTEKDTPITSADLASASSDKRRDLILQGEQVQTPGGRSVDPKASGFDQMISRLGRDSEISGTLEQIRVGLATGGGAPANRFFGAIGDFFQSAEEANKNQERRETMRQALEWFQSRDAELLFFSNPALLEQARRDPVAFWKQATTREDR